MAGETPVTPASRSRLARVEAHDDWWSGLLDLAAPGPGAADTNDVAARAATVGSLVVPDTALPTVEPGGTPLTVVVTGGAGQVAGPARLASRRGLGPAALRVVLRDLDDLRGNARRVVAAVEAARAEGALDEDVVVQVGLPGTEPGADWLGAADEVAALELALALPCQDAPPATVAAWLDAALDRETPVYATGGPAVALLAAVRRCLDGEGPTEVARVLTAAPADAVAGLDAATLARTRRWLPRVGCGPDGPARLATDLADLGVVLD